MHAIPLVSRRNDHLTAGTHQCELGLRIHITEHLDTHTGRNVHITGTTRHDQRTASTRDTIAGKGLQQQIRTLAPLSRTQEEKKRLRPTPRADRLPGRNLNDGRAQARRQSACPRHRRLHTRLRYGRNIFKLRGHTQRTREGETVVEMPQCLPYAPFRQSHGVMYRHYHAWNARQRTRLYVVRLPEDARTFGAYHLPNIPKIPPQRDGTRHPMSIHAYNATAGGEFRHLDTRTDIRHHDNASTRILRAQSQHTAEHVHPDPGRFSSACPPVHHPGFRTTCTGDATRTQGQGHFRQTMQQQVHRKLSRQYKTHPQSFQTRPTGRRQQSRRPPSSPYACPGMNMHRRTRHMRIMTIPRRHARHERTRPCEGRRREDNILVVRKRWKRQPRQNLAPIDGVPHQQIAHTAFKRPRTRGLYREIMTSRHSEKGNDISRLGEQALQGIWLEFVIGVHEDNVTALSPRKAAITRQAGSRRLAGFIQDNQSPFHGTPQRQTLTRLVCRATIHANHLNPRGWDRNREAIGRKKYGIQTILYRGCRIRKGDDHAEGRLYAFIYHTDIRRQC